MSKSYIISILVFFLVVINHIIYAQQPCATDILHQKKLASDPAYKAAFQKMNNDLQKRIAEKKANEAINRTEEVVYQISVVVHVIETGEETGVTDNLTDYAIIEAIKTLTENFRAIYSGTDIEIEFILAKRTSDCKETTGINRIDASMFTQYVRNGLGYGNGIGMSETDIKALSVWSNTDYYNIWIVNKIGDGFVNGFATFPNGDPRLDGVVITAQALINTGTLTHEVGHGLMLYHTFHRAEVNSDSIDPTDCPENTDCILQGDLICDTDPHGLIGFEGCTTENCNTTVSQATLDNYMSYCLNRNNFTPNQKTRMRTTLETVRKSLTTSLGATPPTFIRPISACIPTNIGLKSGTGITRFTLDNLDVVSKYLNTDRKKYVDIACEQQLTLNAGSQYAMKVETSTIPHNVKVYVDYNNDGDFTDKEEEVDSGNTKEIQGIHTFTTSYKTPNLDILFNQPLRMRVVASVTTDKIVTSCEVFNGQAEDYSIFIKKKICTIDSIRVGNQTTCNPASNTYSQSLIITYPDLAFTGNLLVNNQSFAITQSPQTVLLTNLNSDAKPVNIVASFSDDDCQFTQNDAFTAPSSCGTKNSYIVVYPNPTSNEFSYTFTTEQEGNYTIQLFDATGRLIFEGKETKTGATLEGTINLETQPKGLYLLQISDSKTTITTRIVKE